MDEKFQTIVLGLGAMGSAAAYQLAKRGNKVLGIDQFSPPHIYGSTHGDTRITRLAIGEGAQYTPFALRSHELWREIEEETGRQLLTANGGLIISSRNVAAHVKDFFENTVKAAEKYAIEHEVLDASQIRKRFPQFSVQDSEFGYFERGAGFLRPEECIRAQLQLAKKYGASIKTGEKVLGFRQTAEGVSVATDKGTYLADKLIITAGPWLPGLLGGDYSEYFKVIRQVLFWFDVKGSIEPFLPENCPIFIWEMDNKKQGMYGFPAIDGPSGGVKVASEQYETTTTPDTVDRRVSEEETQEMYENFVAPYLPGLSSKCLRSVSCLYTVTPDSGFVIDFHPDSGNILIASPCSGHGFKHSAAIGESLAQLVVEGQSRISIDTFKFNRFKNQTSI